MSTISFASQSAFASPRTRSRSRAFWVAAFSVLCFALIWLAADAIFLAYPYLSTGSDVLYRTKVQHETTQAIFPADPHVRRILISGNSQVMDGFIPLQFDRLAATGGKQVATFNSGYPQRTEFVRELKEIVKNPSNVPDVLLLTNPWGSTPGHFDPFSPHRERSRRHRAVLSLPVSAARRDQLCHQLEKAWRPGQHLSRR